MEKLPKVCRAAAGEDYTVYIGFSDGTVRLLDAEPLIRKGGVFAPLVQKEVFRSCLTVMNGTVAWDMSGSKDLRAGIDLDPIVLYETCPVVEEQPEVFWKK